jgi:hypothetical protein
VRNALLCAALAMAFVAVGSQASSAMQRIVGPSVSKLAEPVRCIGDRRNYRNFNHCWRVNSHKGNVWPARYCSRICGGGRDLG